MAVVTGPLLSFGASGQIAGTQVYSTWKGRPYVRKYLIPANPNSTEQSKTRNSFAFLSNLWKLSPADFRSPWTAYAKGQVLTDRNAWIKLNNSLLREAVDLEGITLSPGAKGGLSIEPTVVGGTGTITVDMEEPSPLPPGWTIVQAVAAAIRDQDPQSATIYQTVAASDASTPYSVVLSGLTAGEYAAGGWFVFQRSASLTDLAYGASIGHLVTVT